MPQYQFAEKAKYKEWFEEYNWGNCKLNRQEYGEFLANYITGEHEGFVLNLNGSWGTGKTHFLKRLYTHLLTKMGHPTIYIDAWESDFIGNPLAVISSELIDQLSSFSELSGDDLENVKEKIGKVLKASAIGASAFLSKQLLGDAAAGLEFTKSLLEQSPEKLMDQVKDESIQQIASVKKARKHLTSLAKTLRTNSNHSIKLPIIVLVDELDRCRPNYAIEILEVIKHFFDTPNFCFVVASDTEQLCHSIKAVYGNEFESETYLKRFFNRKIKLETPDIASYVQSIVDKKDIRPKNPHHSLPDIETLSILDQLILCADSYDLTIRDTDQIISKYKSCIRHISTIETKMIYPFLIIVALIEDHKNNSKFWEGSDQTPMCNNIKTQHGVSVSAFINHAQIISKPDKFIQQKASRNRGVYKPDDIKYRIEDHFIRASQDHLNPRNNTTFWRWEDYRKLVELAGAITD